MFVRSRKVSMPKSLRGRVLYNNICGVSSLIPIMITYVVTKSNFSYFLQSKLDEYYYVIIYSELFKFYVFHYSVSSFKSKMKLALYLLTFHDALSIFRQECFQAINPSKQYKAIDKYIYLRGY